MENTIEIQSDNFNLTGVTNGSVKQAMKSSGATSRDLWYVPISEIVQLDDFNVRVKNAEYLSQVRSIADSIKANGFFPHKPIACMVIKRGGKDILAVIDGHTRHDGAKLAIAEGAPLDKLPVVTTQAGVTLEDAIAGLITNNNGKPLTPMAMGLVCKRLVSFGWSNTKVAEKIAVSVAYVGQLLQLVSAEKGIKELVNDDKISATLAVQVMKDEGEKALKVLQAAVETAETQGKTKATAKHVKSRKPAKQHQEAQEAQEASGSASAPADTLTQELDLNDAVVTANPVVTDSHLQSVKTKAMTWLMQNRGIVDYSHYELIHAITGLTESELA